MHRQLEPIPRMVALTLLVVLASSLGQRCLVSTSNSDSLDEAPVPQHSANLFGLFTVDSYYNMTKLRDRLKLSKGYLRLVVKQMGSNQKFTAKATVAEELIRCENLTLAHAEMESLVQCETLEAQVLAEGLPKLRQTSSIDSKVNYVKKSTVYLKYKPHAMMAQSYPLQREFTKQSVDALLLANGLKSSGYNGLATSHGNYFELTLPVGGIRCSGNLFTLSNMSEPAPVGPARDSYPELLDLMNHHLWEMYSHGGILSLQDVSCEKPNQLIPFSLDLDFSLIRRMEFPFLTVRHTMASQPMSSLWQYEGAIKQWRDNSSKGGAYNTTIKVISESSIFEYLQFTIDQTFVNADPNTGYEQMILNHPLAQAIVKGNWTVDSLMKTLDLYFSDAAAFKENPANQVELSPGVHVDYKDDLNSEHVELGVKLTRRVLKTILDFLLDNLGTTLMRNLPLEQRKPSVQRKPEHQHIEL